MFRDLFSRKVSNFRLLTLWSIHGGDKMIVVGEREKGPSSYQEVKQREGVLERRRKRGKERNEGIDMKNKEA